jgi:hypothetical protein
MRVAPSKLPVEVVEFSNVPIPVEAVVAMAHQNRTVFPGEPVTLDGSASIGAGLSYNWESFDGPVLSDPLFVKPTFTAPAFLGRKTFDLTVSNATGTSTANCRDHCRRGPRRPGHRDRDRRRRDGVGHVGRANCRRLGHRYAVRVVDALTNLQRWCSAARSRGCNEPGRDRSGPTGPRSTSSPGPQHGRIGCPLDPVHHRDPARCAQRTARSRPRPPGNATATVTWTAPAAQGSPITGYTVRVATR